MYNEMFRFYGDDVYKIGKSKDIAKRMTSYTTSYVKPVEIKFLSGLCIDYHLCEKVIFDRLCTYRISPNREFFNLNIEHMVNHIEEVVSGVNNGTITERPPKLLGNHHEPSRSNISDETKAHKLSIVKDCLESLGFQCDDISQPKRLSKEELINNINKLKDTSIFTNNKAYHHLFGSTNKKIQYIFNDDATLKSKLGFINSVLHQCGFSLIPIRKQERKGNKAQYYSLGSRYEEVS